MPPWLIVLDRTPRVGPWSGPRWVTLVCASQATSVACSSPADAATGWRTGVERRVGSDRNYSTHVVTPDDVGFVHLEFQVSHSAPLVSRLFSRSFDQQDDEQDAKWWCDGMMIKRRCAAGMRNAEGGVRRCKDFRQMPTFVVALARHLEAVRPACDAGRVA
jgi:hypothetical protein